MPSDAFSAFMLAGLWPDPGAIESMSAVADSFKAVHTLRISRLDELKQAESTIRQAMVSNDFESMYARLDRLVRDQGIVADNAATIAMWAERFAEECCAAQLSLVSGIEPFRELALECVNNDDYQGANVELNAGRAKAQEILAQYLDIAEGWANLARSDVQVVDPWTTAGNGSPSSSSSKPSGGGEASIQPTDFKKGGGEDSPQSGGRFGADAQQSPSEADSDHDSKDGKEDGKRGHRSGEAAQRDEDSSDVPTKPGRLSGTADQSGSAGGGRPSPTSASSGLGAPAGGLPSPNSGVPSSGGLPAGGLSGVKPPSADGLGLGSQSGLGSAGSGLGSPAAGSGAGSDASAARGGGGMGSGGGAAGGDGGGRLAPPLSAVPPVTSAPPVAGRAEAAAAGGFMPPAGSSVPVQPAAPAGGGSSAVGGGMPAGAMMGAPLPAAPAPPAASPVGPAPTASPGLSQTSLGPGGAAAASGAGGAGAGAAAAGLGVMPTAFSGETPAEVDRYGQLAADAVRVLAPALAVIPGMLVAAAVLIEPGGIPQVVITTNDGAGFLPPGCFLPPTMIHAFADLDSAEFDRKWFGWADPARVLLDYAGERAQRVGSDVRLLGLASSGRITAEVKSSFKQAIPLVTPEASARPLGEDKGRNAHRFKVLAPDFFDALMKAPKDIRDRAVVRAATAAMATPAAAPLRVVGAPWHTMSMVGRPLTEQEWTDFRERYDNEVRMCGALRPGFLTDAGAGAGTGYGERFALVRAMEVLLCWRTAPDVSAADVVYSAHQAGADVNGILA